MWEYEGHIQGIEIESRLECLAVGRYFMNLVIDAEGCIHITWQSLAESGDFTCEAIADCIITSSSVQDALEEFIETGDFNVEGTRSFGGTVNFSDEVNFTGGPVNFEDLTINRDGITFNVDDSEFNLTNTDIILDATSTFTNNGDTVLTNLTVLNFSLDAGSDLSGMLSTDADNCLGIGTDGGLYLDCTGFGGGGSFTCADVADCIDSNPTVQEALSNWLIDALLNDTDLQTALDTYIAGATFTCSDVADCIDSDVTVQEALSNWLIAALTADVDLGIALDAYLLDYIENGNFVTTGNWEFQGDVTFNGAILGSGIGLGIVSTGFITKDRTEASIAQVVPHTLGVPPKYIKFSYCLPVDTNNTLAGWGIRDGTNNRTIGARDGGAQADQSLENNAIYYINASGNGQTADVTAVDAVDFTLDWTKVGAGDLGADIIVLREAHA